MYFLIFIIFFFLLQFSLYRVAFSVPYIQRGPEKNGTGYFLQYVDALTGMVSVYGITSPEKTLYQDKQFWLSSLFLGHIS